LLLFLHLLGTACALVVVVYAHHVTSVSCNYGSREGVIFFTKRNYQVLTF
jgi:hypothetical protein